MEYFELLSRAAAREITLQDLTEGLAALGQVALTGGWHNGCGRYATLEAAMSASQEEIWREGGIPLPGEMDLGGE